MKQKITAAIQDPQKSAKSFSKGLGVMIFILWFVALVVTAGGKEPQAYVSTPTDAYEPARGNKLSDAEMMCLTMNVYHEARGEDYNGRVSVAYATINRLMDPKYPKTMCEVVYEKRWKTDYFGNGEYVAQFSWTLDGRPDDMDDLKAAFASFKAAKDAWNGHARNPIGTMKHYYNPAKVQKIQLWMKNPKDFIVVGNHKFIEPRS